jgi:geranyl-CoA carboxylase alpha subunit
VIDWSAPESIRCDHSLAAGTTVPAWYDSMVAKLVAHAPTRDACIDRLAAAVDRTAFLGVASNRAFLARLLRHPEFRDGANVSTAFIERNFATPALRESPPDARLWALAAWLSVAGAPEAECTPADWRHWSTGLPLPQPWRLRWRAPAAFADSVATMRGRLLVTPCSAQVQHDGGGHTVQGVAVDARRHGHALVDGVRLDYRYAWSGNTLWLHTPCGDYAFDDLRREPVLAARSAAAIATEVRATINGRVVEVSTMAGNSVDIGDRLVVLEAMKMEHEVRAARPGSIAEVAVAQGEQVVPGQLLVRFAGESA